MVIVLWVCVAFNFNCMHTSFTLHRHQISNPHNCKGGSSRKCRCFGVVGTGNFFLFILQITILTLLILQLSCNVEECGLEASLQSGVVITVCSSCNTMYTFDCWRWVWILLNNLKYVQRGVGGHNLCFLSFPFSAAHSICGDWNVIVWLHWITRCV